MLTSSVPEWIPFCVQCANKDQQADVLAAFTDAITAAVDEKEVYVYGAHSFENVTKLKDIDQLCIARHVCPSSFYGPPLFPCPGGHAALWGGREIRAGTD